jgi:REP element-mobilizing transposase RayT
MRAHGPLAHYYPRALRFSTKRRRNSVPDMQALFAYFGGIARGVGVELIIAGGMPNHVHLLFWLPGRRAVSDVIRDFKANFSRWIRRTSPKFEWQQGFGAFSVSPNKLKEVKSYIANQEGHHRKRSFEEKFIALLKMAGIKYDENEILLIR